MACDSICVLGLGYIGLPTASLLATKGVKVLGVDTSAKAVETINAGEIHIHEPDLDVLVRAAVHSGNLKAYTEPQPADAFIIAVPTPVTEGHQPDLSYVRQAAKAIAPVLKPGDLVVVESTISIGATESVCQWIAEERPDLALPSREDPSAEAGPSRIHVAHCPERVLPGQILRELVDNDRVVGGVDPASTAEAVELYRRFCKGAILSTDCRTAELCKLCENAFRDVNIAYANELSMICDEFDIDVWTLISLANRHPRVNILKPGPGVGGHCIAVDPWFIVASTPETARLIHRAREVNDSKPGHVVAAVRAKADRLKNPIIACLGLAFKADVDDLRGSPAVTITRQLAEENVGTILAVEPHIEELPEALARCGVEKVGLGDALNRADVIVLLVDHRQFTAVDRHQYQDKILIDTRGAWR
jgi:UDP-N-acetyl-D-mannosaminuronic acid dehydrogenase